MVASARFCYTALVLRASKAVGIPLPPQGSSPDHISERLQNGI
jgi:hypothetical protein